MTKFGNSLLLRLIIVVCIGLYDSSPSFAQTSPDKLKHDTETKLGAVVRTSVEAYFARINEIRPDTIEVDVNATVATVTGIAGELAPAVQAVSLDVAMASDLSSEQTKEMRQSILKALMGQGFQTEVMPSADEFIPKASLKIAVTPAPTQQRVYSWKDLSIVSLLATLAMGLLALSIYLILIPWRRQRTTVPLDFGDDRLSERDFTLDPHKFSLLAYESPRTVRAVFTTIPIEQVMGLLTQLDQKSQRKIIKKLNLKSSVRTKLEQELGSARL